MNPFPLSALTCGLFAVCMSLATTAAWADLDAGAQIRRLQDETLRRLGADRAPPPRGLDVLPPTRSTPVSSGERIHVAAFSLEGVTQFTPQAIAAVLRPFVGRALDTQGIHAAADAVTALYRDAGFFVAQVFVPPQEVADTVQLHVYEGMLDQTGIEVVNRGSRIDGQIVADILRTHLGQGRPIQRVDFERALLLAEDLPGVTTSSVLYPGDKVGTARLRTTITDLAGFTGNVDLDNFGNRATGQTRLGTTLYVNSPLQRGDQATLRLVTSGKRSNYAYLTYLVPTSPAGTRVGASVDHFSYDSRFITNLGLSDGHASDARLYVTHPIVRSRHGNLSFRGDASRLAISDRNDLGVNGRRDIDTVTLALHGDDDHPWLMTGLTVFDASLSVGRVDIEGNAAYVAADSSTAQTRGRFARVNLNVSRLTRLSDHWSFLSRFSGQWASANLDPSQKFYIGGGTSVAGYPLGEAGGDLGAEAALELRHDFPAPWAGTLMGSVSVQQGWVRMHKRPWPGWQGANTELPNELGLTSVGLGVTATLPGETVLRGLLGWQVGTNPMRDPVTLEASDGRASRFRAWIQAIHYF